MEARRTAALIPTRPGGAMASALARLAHESEILSLCSSFISFWGVRKLQLLLSHSRDRWPHNCVGDSKCLFISPRFCGGLTEAVQLSFPTFPHSVCRDVPSLGCSVSASQTVSGSSCIRHNLAIKCPFCLWLVHLCSLLSFIPHRTISHCHSWLSALLSSFT